MDKPVKITLQVNEKKAGGTYLVSRRGYVELIFYITQKQMNEYSEEVLKEMDHGVSK